MQRRPLKKLLIAWLARRRWTGRTLRRGHHFHAEIANFAQAQACQWWKRFRHLTKHIFDRAEAIAAGKLLQEIAQDLPILARLPGRTNAPIQALQTAASIDPSAAFSGVCRGGKDRSSMTSG